MALGPDFVQTGGTGFVVAGQRFPVVGLNSYFLAYCSDPSRLAVIAAAKQMGANAIRAWAFLNVDNRSPGSVAFQYLNEGAITVDGGPDGLERLDALIEAAEQQDFRLILPLVNYWNDFGGMPLYLKWLGVAGGVEQFYTSPAARAAYQTWVEAVLTRQNTRTGRLYSEEPAVMAWELANEPRCEVAGGRELFLDWVGEMSRYVKTLDSNHLLAVGDEGLLLHPETNDPLYDGSHGVDGEAILNFGEIDFGTYHFYPSSMAHSNDFAATWIADHVASGARANKPMLLEEYGLGLGAALDASGRNQWYARWLGSVFQAGGAGDLLWMIGGSAPDVAGFRDEYTVLSGTDVPAVAAHASMMGVGGGAPEA
ncbi:MAG TPA: cellulase family glycosylhydrolase [Terriglobia bacterium]